MPAEVEEELGAVMGPRDVLDPRHVALEQLGDPVREPLELGDAAA